MKKKIVTIVAILLLILGGYGVYYMTYSYAATPQQSEAFTNYDVIEAKNWDYFPGQQDMPAIVIYQGARVDAKAYSLLAAELQAKGYHVFISKMFLNWAFFNMDVIEKMENNYPQIEHWYLGGHSLGGVIASEYAYKHIENPKLKGLFFLASYPAKDFENFHIPMLALFGEVDGLVTSDARIDYRAKTSNSKFNKEIIIPGANHAQFGVYGSQKGDNSAQIDVITQQVIIAEQLGDWINAIES